MDQKNPIYCTKGRALIWHRCEQTQFKLCFKFGLIWPTPENSISTQFELCCQLCCQLNLNSVFGGPPWRPQGPPGRRRRPQETPGDPRRPQEAPVGTRRPQDAPGGPRHQEAPGDPTQEAPRSTRRPQEIPGGPRKPQEAPGGPRRPSNKTPGAY